MTGIPDTQEARARAEVAEVNAAAGPDPVRLGVLTPLTGPGDATAGELIVRGARLGANWVAERGGVLGGRRISFVLQNDQPVVPGELMQRSCVGGIAQLAAYDRVTAVLGQWHLRTAPHVAEVAEALGVPLFVENGHNTLTARRRRTLFRTYLSVADRTPMMVRFAVEQAWTKIAVLAADTVFGLMNAETFAEQAGRAGIEIRRHDFDQEATTDLRGPLAELKAWGPDALFNCGVVRTNYLVINQAEEVGLLPGVPLLVAFPFPMRSADYWRLAGAAGNNVVWAATTFRPGWAGLTPIGSWFVERYAERYGSFPPDNALNAFTDVTIVAQALDRAGSDDRDRLLDALEQGEYDTWRGPVRFERGAEHWHHSPPEFMLMQYTQVGQTLDDAPVIWPPEVATADYVPPAGR